MKPFVTLTLSLLALNGISQNLFINEIIADNGVGQMDDFFQREDWVEIYNTGGITNLAGYYISDDPLDLIKWQIPATNAGVTTVLPNSHIILWLDKDPEQGEDHVDFSLNPDGETLLLVAADGITIIDQITFPTMATDVSYGRTTDGAATWQYFNNVTYDADNFELIQAPELLFINEVQVNNISTWKDLQNEFDPWFEIYNPNGFQVNLAGYSISLSDGSTWAFPTADPVRTVVPAGGFKLFWADGETADGTNHASFALTNVSETLTLKALFNTTVDVFNYTAVDEDHSWGRQSDGSAATIDFLNPTQEVTNSLVIITPPTLFINEVLTINFADTTDFALQFEDWFEVYNPNSTAVSLAGYYFSDNPENPRKWQVPNYDIDSVTVPANGWMLFWADEDMGQGIRHASFKLKNNDESLRFTSPDGITLVDEISWIAMNADSSYGRITDGASQWVTFVDTTPEASNNGALVNVKEETANNFSLSVYPNPVISTLYFSSESNIVVYAASGQLHANYTKVKSIDTRNWAAGLYFISNTRGQLVKIIKE
jgi:hypothetical protein